MANGDRSLLIRLRAREPEACEAFVDAHYRGVYGFFVWLTSDPDAAADLTQETFMGFWASTIRLDPVRVPDLKAWLYGIARNRWRKRCRNSWSQGGRERVPLDGMKDLPDPEPGPEAAVVAAAGTAEVARAMGDLPPDYREALALRVFQELSYSQIAEALGIGVGLARWRVHRARCWLRQALEAGEDSAQRGEEKSGVRLG